MASIKAAFKSFAAKYTHFVEHQGFMVILTVCIGVIAGTAAWTNHAAAPTVMPTPPVSDAASVAQLLQQSLDQAATPTPAPTQTVPIWHAPLPEISVLRGFQASRMVQSGVTGLWQIHDGVDLRCQTGDPVYAMADGTVTAIAEKGLRGYCVTISHGQITSEYAGMSLGAGLRVDDPIQAGQIIGFGGNGMMDETDMEPHLHLRILENGQAVDPIKFLKNAP